MTTLLFALILLATPPSTDTLQLGSNTLTLHAKAWRNMMPSPGNIDRGTVIAVWLVEENNFRIPPVLEITRIWAIYNDRITHKQSVWQSNYAGQRHIHSLTVRSKLTYDEGTYISVVAEIWDTRTNRLHYVGVNCVRVDYVY